MRNFILSSAMILVIASLITISCKKTKKPDPAPTILNEKVYKTVTIGTQTWMAENLNYQGDKLTPGTYSCYDSMPQYCDIYGTLYTYDAALKACPTGWHLPTDDEWKTMEEYLGMSVSDANMIAGSRGAELGVEVGKKLKITGNSGFNVLYGGFYESKPSSQFRDEEFCGSFWTATSGMGGDTLAIIRRIIAPEEASGVYRQLENKSNLNSVRCIKD